MAAGVIVAGAAAAAQAAQRRAFEAAGRTWQPYAEAEGLHYAPGRMGWAHVQWPRVDGIRESTPVAFELVPHQDGVVRTAILASLPLPMAGNVEVAPEGVLARIAKAFGAQDIVVGDEPFDCAYRIRGTSEDVARAALTATVRAEMLALGADRFLYDDGSAHAHVAMVVLEVPRVVEEPESLDRALRAVLDVSRARLSRVPYR